MAIEISDVVRRVRSEILIDLDESAYRWTDNVLTSFVRHTVYDLLKLKKHLLVDDNGLPTSSSTIAEAETTIPLPSKYEDALVHGVASLAFLQDSADQYNANRASYELAKFKECAGVQTTA